MSKRTRSLKACAILLGMTTVLVACNNDSNSYSSNQQVEQAATPKKEVADNNNQPTLNMTDMSTDYMIYTADIELETIDFNTAKEALVTILKEKQVMVQHQNESGIEMGNQFTGSNKLRTLTMTIRVPKDKFAETYEALQTIESTHLSRVNQGSEDVTKSIQDLDIRIKAAEERINRLNELLKKTDKIEEILRLQTEIENAIVEKESLQSRKASLDDQVDLSTITVSLVERNTIDSEEKPANNFRERVQKSFRVAVRETRKLFENLVIFAINLLPLILALFVLWLLYIFLIRPINRLFGKLDRAVAPKEKVEPVETVVITPTDSTTTKVETSKNPGLAPRNHTKSRDPHAVEDSKSEKEVLTDIFKKD